jgi:hypothetical protein
LPPKISLPNVLLPSLRSPVGSSGHSPGILTIWNRAAASHVVNSGGFRPAQVAKRVAGKPIASRRILAPDNQRDKDDDDINRNRS